MKPTLYDLPADFAALEMALEESGGEITPEIDARMAELFAGGAEALENAGKLVHSLLGQSAVAEREAERLSDRAASFKRRAENVRRAILPALIAMGGKCKTPLFTFGTQNRSNVAFALKPDAEIWDLPARFYRVSDPALNLQELKAAHKAGETIPDCLAVSESSSTSLVMR